MTVTSTVPAAWAGVIAMIWVALVVLTFVAASPPTLTVAPTTKPVPVIVIPVPPASGPPFGTTLVTAGGGTKVKQPVQVALWPSTLVTTTLTSPAAWAGVVATTIVAGAKVTVPGVPPKLTVSGPAKSLPLIVTPRPPAMEPLVGETAVMVGAGRKMKQPVHGPVWPAGLGTTALP